MPTTPNTVTSEISMNISDKGGMSSKGADSKVTKSGEPAEKMQKRTHSEVSDASMEELGFIQNQLETLTTDLKETKEGEPQRDKMYLRTFRHD